MAEVSHPYHTRRCAPFGGPLGRGYRELEVRTVALLIRTAADAVALVLLAGCAAATCTFGD
jgi:hypothetical protein